MTFFEDPVLNSLTFAAPGVLVDTAFLVVFLTHKPRRRGLTLAMIGCALSLLTRSIWILFAWSEFRHDMSWLVRTSDGIYVTKMVLWIVALHLLYRDSRQHVPAARNADA